MRIAYFIQRFDTFDFFILLPLLLFNYGHDLYRHGLHYQGDRCSECFFLTLYLWLVIAERRWPIQPPPSDPKVGEVWVLRANPKAKPVVVKEVTEISVVFADGSWRTRSLKRDFLNDYKFVPSGL